MTQPQPLVSIGIPTYNRSSLLSISIESALRQDFTNVEVIVSDNASTDETELVCQSYASKDSRIRYFRHAVNQGATQNFRDVLECASGAFFMWLGDDDWIDQSYVSTCVRHLEGDPELSLVSGTPHYYRDGRTTATGQLFDLLHDRWFRRVLSYYWRVSDNGIFYGLMRTKNLRLNRLENTMGGDWLLMARMAALGKTRMLNEIGVHREMGGATASYRQVAKTLGLKSSQASFPMLSIALSAWSDIISRGEAYQSKPRWARLLVGCATFAIILLKPAAHHLGLTNRNARPVR